MVNHRKSPEQKKLEGTFRRDRDMATMAPSEPLGSAPEYLSPEQKAAWDELVLMIPAGVLFKPDRLILEQVARLVATQRTEGLCITEVKLLLQCLGKIGLSPLDRTRVPAAAPKPDRAENRFSKFD